MEIVTFGLDEQSSQAWYVFRHDGPHRWSDSPWTRTGATVVADTTESGVYLGAPAKRQATPADQLASVR